MTSTRLIKTDAAAPVANLALAALAWSAAAAGLMLGVGPLTTALVVLAGPLFAFVVVGHLASRGVVMTCLVTAIGVGVVRASGVPADLGAIGLLAVLGFAAFAAGNLADALLAPAVETAAIASPPGRWVTIVVESTSTVQHAPMMPGRRSPRRRPTSNAA